MCENKKTCIKCAIKKPLNEFSKRKDSKDGYRNNCSVCEKITKKDNYINNREEFLKRSSDWKKNNPERVKKYRKDNPDKKKKDDKKYYEKNKKEILEQQRVYGKKPESKKIRNETNRKRKLKDPLHKMTLKFRKITGESYKKCGYSKDTKIHSEEILGCDFITFKNHIENKWLLPYNLDSNGNVWMNYNNYGLYEKNVFNHGWDIDHIIPLSSAKTQERLFELCHHTNLQPLCSYTNRHIKRDRLDYYN